ncbi:hypothetical protein JST97_35985 [bacterium]|nr:hypothetical protein [bacterium]
MRSLLKLVLMDRLQGISSNLLPFTRKPQAGSEPSLEPTDSFKAGEGGNHLLEVSRKSLVIGAGLTLVGVPLPVSAGVAAVHFVSEAAPETTAKVLSNTALIATGTVALAATLAAPVAALAGTVVQHAMGHDFLPGFSS